MTSNLHYASDFIESLPMRIINKSNGAIAECTIEILSSSNQAIFHENINNHNIYGMMDNLLIAIFKAASSVVDLIGTANEENIKTVKHQIDAMASAAFEKEYSLWKENISINTSEGKDENASFQPRVETSSYNEIKKSDFGIAVDAVDGTTLTALGFPGAYSICALNRGLVPFPDIQAYAILAPTSAFERLDLHSQPELSIQKNLEIIADSLGKNIDELTVVTHSEDNGYHHKSIIKTMEELGVKVIIPSPVIVESPFAIATAIGNAHNIDAIIGIFGLPEIIINTILCGILNREKGFVFRLASNSMMKSKEKSTLEDLNKFSNDELNEINEFGLNIDKIYKYDNITSGKHSGIFAATAITDDHILNMKGLQKEDGFINAEGLFADPYGNLYKVMMRLRD